MSKKIFSILVLTFIFSQIVSVRAQMKTLKQMRAERLEREVSSYKKGKENRDKKLSSSEDPCKDIVIFFFANKFKYKLYLEAKDNWQKYKCEAIYPKVWETVIVNVNREDYSSEEKFLDDWFSKNNNRCDDIFIDYTRHEATAQEWKEEGCERRYPSVWKKITKNM